MKRLKDYTKYQGKKRKERKEIKSKGPTKKLTNHGQGEEKRRNEG